MAKAPIFGAAEGDARQTRAKAKDDAEEAQVESALHKKNQKRASPPISGTSAGAGKQLVPVLRTLTLRRPRPSIGARRHRL